MVPHEDPPDIGHVPSVSPPSLPALSEDSINAHRVRFEVKRRKSLKWENEDSVTIRGKTFKLGKRLQNSGQQVCRSSPENVQFVFIGFVKTESFDLGLRERMLREGADMKNPQTCQLAASYAIFVEADKEGGGFRIVRPD